MTNRSVALLVLLSGLLFSASAFAANGYATANVNMRTGPSVYYPRITVIPAGSPVTIYHCTQALRWCNLRWRAYRGWVFARYLEFDDYRPRIYVPPPAIYFDFDFRERRWSDRHRRWHKARPYPRRKKPVIRRDWNRDHDRWHKTRPYPRRKKPVIRRDFRRDHDRWHSARPYPPSKKPVIRRDWKRDHDRWHRQRRVPKQPGIRPRWCPPNRECD